MGFQPFGRLPNQLNTRELTSFRALSGGTLTAQELVIAGGTQGVIRSQNYDGSSAGWAIFGDGSASFYGDVTLGANAIIQGDVYSSNWDGTIPANLASVDAGATVGYYLDSSVGAAQFEGNVYLGGILELQGGAFRTAAAGKRVEITDNDRIRFYTGAADEIQYGYIWADASGTSPLLKLTSPAITGPTSHTVTLANDSVDFLGVGTTLVDIQQGSSGAQFSVGAVDILDLIGGANVEGLSVPNIATIYNASNQSIIGVSILDGSATHPALRFLDDTDLGFYRVGSDQLGVSVGGTNFVRFRDSVEAAIEVAVDDASETYLRFWENESFGAVRTYEFRRSASFGSLEFFGITSGGTETKVWTISDGGNVELLAGGGSMRIFSQDGGDSWLPHANGNNYITFDYNSDAGFTEFRSFAPSSTYVSCARIIDGSSGSSLYLKDGLTDVGNHETLRLDRGTGAGTLRAVGYYSSWLNDPDTGERRKYRVAELGSPSAERRWWKRDWFMDLRPAKYERVRHDSSDFGDGRQIEIGFFIENLIEHTNLLTTKGDKVGGTPDEYALLAVTVDYVQHLEERVAALEAALN